jgi:hypothetical protein
VGQIWGTGGFEVKFNTVITAGGSGETYWKFVSPPNKSKKLRANADWPMDCHLQVTERR